MKTHYVLTVLTLAILISSPPTTAKQAQPISAMVKIEQFLNKAEELLGNLQETELKLAPSLVLAGVLCFVAASISSAGGIGGGGLFIPVLTIVAGLDLKTASSFSAFMVTGGSIANVICNMFTTSTKLRGKTLIDYDIALLSEPCMLLGVSVGVICNLVFPEWLVTILFALFLAWSTFKTCKNGVFHWRFESEELKKNRCEILDTERLDKDGSNTDAGEDTISTKEPLLTEDPSNNLEFPWVKLGILAIIWFSFSFVYLLRGNRDGQGIIPIQPCGLGYWVLSSLQIPLAVIFTVWILLRKDNSRHQTNQQDIEDFSGGGIPNRMVFPIIALLAGMLGGVFGIGGGMLVSPLLLQVGIGPEVTAATCSFMVFFSSTMSALQYLLLGMKHTDTALIFAIVCFVASLLGLQVVQRAIHKHGRVSLIVFSVSIVMALSTVLMTSYGAINVWRDYKTGNNMGFKMPC